MNEEERPVRRIKVLIVDDDPDDRFFIIHYLSKVREPKVASDSAGSGEEALQRIRDQEYHLIFCDYHLPDLTGAVFIEKVRMQECKAPVVILSGLEDAEVESRLLAAGAVDFVKKKEINSESMRLLLSRLLPE